MAGTQTGYSSQTGFSLDILSDNLLREINELGGEIPDDVCISLGGRGVSLYDPEKSILYLEQSPFDKSAYEWTPAANCRVVLMSSDACVEVLNSYGFRKICREGDGVSIDAGIKTKFSVSSTTGSAQLKVHATDPT